MRHALRILADLLTAAVLVVTARAIVTGDVDGPFAGLVSVGGVLALDLRWSSRQARLDARKLAVAAGIAIGCALVALSVVGLGWVALVVAGVVWQAINDDGGKAPAATAALPEPS
jgi:hypothetical protein